MTRTIVIHPPNVSTAHERRKLVELDGHTIPARIYRPSLGPLDEGQAAYREADALIDTGASHVFIDNGIAGELNLPERNKKNISTVRGDVGGIGYSGRLLVRDLLFDEHIELVAMKGAEKRMNYQIVLGRAFLERFFFEYDGPNGQLVFHLADPFQIDDDYAG